MCEQKFFSTCLRFLILKNLPLHLSFVEKAIPECTATSSVGKKCIQDKGWVERNHSIYSDFTQELKVLVKKNIFVMFLKVIYDSFKVQ